MSVQNPTIPTATQAKGIDAVIIDLQTHLSFELSWLTNGMGRAYKLKKTLSNGSVRFWPMVYLGTDKSNYFPAIPDNDKEGQSIILVGDGTPINQQRGKFGVLEYPVSIIFSVNLKTINSALLETEIFTEHLMENVRQALIRDMLGKPYTLAIDSETMDFDSVYSEFDINTDAGKTNKPLAPMTYFRFDTTIQMRESCPPTALNRCEAILQNLTTEDTNECVWPTIDLSDPNVQGNSTAKQVIDGTAWLCSGPGAYVNNHSMRFNGINQDIATSYNSAFDFDNTDSFTLSGRVVRVGLNVYLFSKYDATFMGYLLRIQNGLLWFYFTNTNNTNQIQVRTIATTPLTAFHFSVTYDGSSAAAGVKMYIDGVAVATTDPVDSLTATTKSTDLLYHGSARQSTFEACDLNVMRGWNVAHTPAQVALDYNADVPDTPILPLNMVIGNTMGDGAVFGVDTWCLPDESGVTTGSQSYNMNFASRIAAI